MKLVVDTNVFISGVFFRGPPHQILRAWRDGKVQLVISPAILREYHAVGAELTARFPEIDLAPWWGLLYREALIVDALPLSEPVCSDRDDDKFLACAVASETGLIASGDKALLRASGYQGITVLSPRQFVDTHLRLR
jgi:putative PIN family toxin of toxin-antitoxin system